MTQTILYCRVSTAEQTIQTQRKQAEDAGFKIDQVIEDHGMSGVTTLLSERDGGKRLFDILREGDVLLVRWLDRLGRNYDDIQLNMRHFLDKGVTIKTVINGMVFEARPADAMSKAVRDAILSFMAAMAEAQAIANKEAQAAGIAHAKQLRPEAYKGRKPSYNHRHLEAIFEMSGDGVGVNEMARRLGLNKFLVSRLNKDLSAGYAALERWGIPEPDDFYRVGWDGAARPNALTKGADLAAAEHNRRLEYRTKRGWVSEDNTE